MAIITTYTDEPAANTGDKYLTVSSDGSTKLTTYDTLKDGILANGSVTATKLSTSAITLGYASRTTSHSSSNTAPTQVTGLTVTVTIPTGGRRIKITAWTPEMTSGASNANAYMSIWDGVVGSGTQLAYTTSYSSSSVIASGALVMAVVSPTGGASKTYNVAFNVGSGTGTFVGSASSPSFILVEAI